MNREILFIGQRVDTKEWVKGDLIHLDSRIMIADKGMSAYDKGNPHEHISIECVEVKPETVGQFTNVFDNNGSKIFEGQKIRTKHGTVYDVKDMIEFHSWLDRQFVTNPEKYIEIIGNAE